MDLHAGEVLDPFEREVEFQLLHLEIEAAKKLIMQTVVQRMQNQQQKMFGIIKEILNKQRADTIMIIKKALGRS